MNLIELAEQILSTGGDLITLRNELFAHIKKALDRGRIEYPESVRLELLAKDLVKCVELGARFADQFSQT